MKIEDMPKYHKIHTIWKREPQKPRKLIEGEWSAPEFGYLQNNQWLFSEKVDGTNIRIGWDAEDKSICFGGRTERAQLQSSLVTRLTELFTSEKLLAVFPENQVILFGEGYGAKIQKSGGKYKSDGVDFALFDISIGNWWLKRERVEEIARELNIGIVPFVGCGTLANAVKLCKEGFNSAWGDFLAEGLVMRPAVELRDRGWRRVIAKLKYRDFHRSE